MLNVGLFSWLAQDSAVGSSTLRVPVHAYPLSVQVITLCYRAFASFWAFWGEANMDYLDPYGK